MKQISLHKNSVDFTHLIDTIEDAYLGLNLLTFIGKLTQNFDYSDFVPVHNDP